MLKFRGINSLLARDEDLAADTALVAKFKVGKEPLEARRWDFEDLRRKFEGISRGALNESGKLTSPCFSRKPID